MASSNGDRQSSPTSCDQFSHMLSHTSMPGLLTPPVLAADLQPAQHFPFPSASAAPGPPSIMPASVSLEPSAVGEVISDEETLSEPSFRGQGNTLPPSHDPTGFDKSFSGESLFSNSEEQSDEASPRVTVSHASTVPPYQPFMYPPAAAPFLFSGLPPPPPHASVDRSAVHSAPFPAAAVAESPVYAPPYMYGMQLPGPPEPSLDPVFPPPAMLRRRAQSDIVGRGPRDGFDVLSLEGASHDFEQQAQHVSTYPAGPLPRSATAPTLLFTPPSTHASTSALVDLSQITPDEWLAAIPGDTIDEIARHALPSASASTSRSSSRRGTREDLSSSLTSSDNSLSHSGAASPKSRTGPLRPTLYTDDGLPYRKRMAQMTPEERERLRESNRVMARRIRARQRQQRDMQEARLAAVEESNESLRRTCEELQMTLAATREAIAARRAASPAYNTLLRNVTAGITRSCPVSPVTVASTTLSSAALPASSASSHPSLLVPSSASALRHPRRAAAAAAAAIAALPSSDLFSISAQRPRSLRDGPSAAPSPLADASSRGASRRCSAGPLLPPLSVMMEVPTALPPPTTRSSAASSGTSGSLSPSAPLYNLASLLPPTTQPSLGQAQFPLAAYTPSLYAPPPPQHPQSSSSPLTPSLAATTVSAAFLDDFAALGVPSAQVGAYNFALDSSRISADGPDPSCLTLSRAGQPYAK